MVGRYKVWESGGLLEEELGHCLPARTPLPQTNISSLKPMAKQATPGTKAHAQPPKGQCEEWPSPPSTCLYWWAGGTAVASWALLPKGKSPRRWEVPAPAASAPLAAAASPASPAAVAAPRQ